MSRLTIDTPSPAIPVVAGAPGTIDVAIHPSFMEVPGRVTAAIRDVYNQKVWAAEATSADDQAFFRLNWPLAPGIYTLEVVCYGILVGILADATQQFSVVAPAG